MTMPPAGGQTNRNSAAQAAWKDTRFAGRPSNNLTRNHSEAIFILRLRDIEKTTDFPALKGILYVKLTIPISETPLLQKTS